MKKPSVIVDTFYKFGFEYKGVIYGWKFKKLYKLPYTKGLRSYQLKEIPMHCPKSTALYNIQRDKFSLKQLKEKTIEINVSIISLIDYDCPF